MMAFVLCIAIGLFLQAGRSIYLAEPVLGLITCILVGPNLWNSAASLLEMSALFPVHEPIIEFPAHFLDKTLGYTAGWMAW